MSSPLRCLQGLFQSISIVFNSDGRSQDRQRPYVTPRPAMHESRREDMRMGMMEKTPFTCKRSHCIVHDEACLSSPCGFLARWSSPSSLHLGLLSTFCYPQSHPSHIESTDILVAGRVFVWRVTFNESCFLGRPTFRPGSRDLFRLDSCVFALATTVVVEPFLLPLRFFTGGDGTSMTSSSDSDSECEDASLNMSILIRTESG